jgi:aminopeptidase N
LKTQFTYRSVPHYGYITIILFLLGLRSYAQVSTNKVRLSSQEVKYSRADSLIGGVNRYRLAYDVKHYAITLKPNYSTKTLEGNVVLAFVLKSKGLPLQIDLDTGLVATQIWLENPIAEQEREQVRWERISVQLLVRLPTLCSVGNTYRLHITYAGKPIEAPRPPWTSGVVWSRDTIGAPWMGVTCQPSGGHIWFPCKASSYDLPDSGSSITLIVPDSLTGVANGRLLSKTKLGIESGFTAWKWDEKTPIHHYGISWYVGRYSPFRFELPATPDRQLLDVTCWLLMENDSAHYNYLQPRVRKMLDTMEAINGPYPAVQDGYQLVEAPYLGMEHQSAVAYGGSFRENAAGFDFILVHESGHEWWGNCLMAEDQADLWIHEAFCTYNEVLYLERVSGKEVAIRYLNSLLTKIGCEQAMVGSYLVNYHGFADNDVYYRGALMLHTLRKVVGDARFFSGWKLLLQHFRHKPTHTDALLAVMNVAFGYVAAPLCRLYLKNSCVPILRTKASGNSLSYRLEEYRGPAFSINAQTESGEKRIVLDGSWRSLSGVRDLRVTGFSVGK